MACPVSVLFTISKIIKSNYALSSLLPEGALEYRVLTYRVFCILSKFKHTDAQQSRRMNTLLIQKHVQRILVY
jgi:hypothetical protein